MNRERKPRGDAILKTLPKERQAEIAEHANTHTLVETCAWLRADGLPVGKSALSEWLAWWSWQQRFKLVEADALHFMEQMRSRRPDLSEEQVEQFGNDFFQLQAIKLGDPKTFLAFRNARARASVENRKLALAERRVVLLERRADQADQAEKVTRDTGLSPEEKQQEYRRIFGMS